MTRSGLSLAVALGALGAVTLAAPLPAQTYPSKPVSMIVPFAAGGATDTLARFLGEKMREKLGQPVIIENVAGAGGSIALNRASRAPADGYTLQIGTSTTNMLLGGLYTLQFDLLNDLDPILLIASEPLMIVGKKALAAHDLKGLIAWLKANPDKASIGIPAVGGTGHLAGLAFLKEIGAQAQFIPYRGNGPALQDLVAGNIDMQIEPSSNFFAQVRAGTIKAFAITAKTRTGAAPDIPTTDQAGLPGYHASLWYGLWAPKGTPKDVVAKLNATMLDVLNDPAVKKRFAELALDVPAREQQTPEALRAFQKAEADKWWPIIKAANIKPN
jgi:tripartite-type tricarboxylate transporter receptor subunit TctC